MPNRLSTSSSPYLKQHQNNPIDWFPWCEEALEKARVENKPIFLSVGYSSCHWCHVMAHESFEDEAVASLLNEHFVSIKVDREERPDIDEAYMAAVHLSSGRGGWPMTLFLTPELDPFFAGTYFPKDETQGALGFRQIVQQVAVAWKTKRAEIDDVSREFRKSISNLIQRAAPETKQDLSREALRQAIDAVLGGADLENGGFGTQPKFPPHTAISLLLSYASDQSVDIETRQSAIAIALHSLDCIARGGIHDHVGGGFHRYSVDATWHVPHFEKMLYDNALLLDSYSDVCDVISDRDPEFCAFLKHTTSGIVRWMKDEMLLASGFLASSVDADTQDGEGFYYTWTETEARELLGDRYEAFSKAYSFKAEGNYDDEASARPSGRNILHLTDEGQDDVAALAILKEARKGRNQPNRDDKAILGWNALAVKGLAYAHQLEFAEVLAQRIWEHTQSEGMAHLLNGPSEAAFLDDYAYWADALYVLNEVTEDSTWRDKADAVVDEMVDRFYDDREGGFFFTQEKHFDGFGRTKPIFDQPIPGPNAIALSCLIKKGDFRRAQQSLRLFSGWIEAAPQMCEGLIKVAYEFFDATRRDSLSDISISLLNVRKSSVGVLIGQLVIDLCDGLHLTPFEKDKNLASTLGQVFVDLDQLTGDRWTDHVEIPFWIEIGDKEVTELDLRLSYQLCTETECLPENEVNMTVKLENPS